MKRIIGWLLQIIFFLNLHHSTAQEMPFNRGVNLTSWFQAGSVRQIQFTRYSRKDFEQIKSLGCDVIRVPVNLHFMTDGAPNYRIDPLFYTFFDQVVDWAEELEMHLILDNHTFDPATETDPGIGNVLEKVWLQVADHYKDRSTFLYYEVLNEPHGISDSLWNDIQQRMVEVIRTVDAKHTIIVGPAGWNSYHNLAAMPVYEDDNLIYTFHFYDPFLFTHQGASWTGPSMEPLAGVPFPYEAGRMPALPSTLKGTWLENAFNDYQTQGTVARVKELIDIAVRFQEERGVPLFCGEFGVYIRNSNENDRVFWYQVVRQYLEEKHIAWTSWDYHGGFGLFKKGGNGLFNHDLNLPLIEALGLTSPPQTPFQVRPDTTGFGIYFDLMGSGIFESSYGAATIDYYAEDQPNNGDYCLKWAYPDQYNVIGFDLAPDRDLSELVADGYALDFLVRGDTPGASFDIRFLDTKTAVPDDRPWRMRFTINETAAPWWDRRWHHLHIPLRSFAEHGAWDDGWFPPRGQFDWKAVDRFEIVAEYGSLQSATFWFDNIQISNQDTAKVYVQTTFPDATTTSTPLSLAPSVKIFPNPVSNQLNLENLSREMLHCRLYDGLGRPLRDKVLVQTEEIDLSSFPAGFYLLSIDNGKKRPTLIRIVKN